MPADKFIGQILFKLIFTPLSSSLILLFCMVLYGNLQYPAQIEKKIRPYLYYVVEWDVINHESQQDEWLSSPYGKLTVREKLKSSIQRRLNERVNANCDLNCLRSMDLGQEEGETLSDQFIVDSYLTVFDSIQANIYIISVLNITFFALLFLSLMASSESYNLLKLPTLFLVIPLIFLLCSSYWFAEAPVFLLYHNISTTIYIGMLVLSGLLMLDFVFNEHRFQDLLRAKPTGVMNDSL